MHATLYSSYVLQQKDNLDLKDPFSVLKYGATTYQRGATPLSQNIIQCIKEMVTFFKSILLVQIENAEFVEFLSIFNEYGLDIMSIIKPVHVVAVPDISSAEDLPSHLAMVPGSVHWFNMKPQQETDETALVPNW